MLIYINKNYDNKNDFKLEYIKLFLKNEQSYIDKIKDLSKNSPESNKSKLEKILAQKIESVKLNLESNSLNINDIIHEHKIENEMKNIIKKEDIIITCNKTKLEGQKKIEKNIKEDIINTSDEIKEKKENIISTTNNINKIINLENNNTTKVNEKNDSEDNINKKDSIKSDDINLNNQNKSIENNIGKGFEDKTSKEDSKINEQFESTEITYKKSNEIENQKTVKDYLKEKYEKYKTINFIPLSLEYIITKNKSFKPLDISYVRLLKNKNIKFNSLKNLNDKILEDLLYVLDLKNSIPDTEKYGCFCYKDGNENIEALYYIIDSLILYNDIIRINKAEDVYKKNDTIRNI